MKPLYRITYHGSAFGDNLFSSYVVATLRANGYDAVLDNPSIAHLVECAKYSPTAAAGREVRTFDCVRRNRPGKQTLESHTVYTDLLKEFRREFGIDAAIEATLDHIPVALHAIAFPDHYDVILVTQTGNWTPYRNWPYFAELKLMLKEASITHFDATLAGCRDNNLLNRVRQSRLYVGLETGASHYVSKFANDKALIIQSGFAGFGYWAGAYRYECIAKPMACSICWKRAGCDTHACMTEIPASRVFERIQARLAR